MDAPKQSKDLGYGWGYIWCLLMALLTIGSFYWAIVLLMKSGERPSFNLLTGIVLMISGCVYGANTYGMLTKKVWALILTYALLLVFLISELLFLWSRFKMNISGSWLAVWVIFIIIGLAIDLLFFGYFFRRKQWYQ